MTRQENLAVLIRAQEIGQGHEDSPEFVTPLHSSKEWALLDSNQRLLPCEDSTLAAELNAPDAA